LLNHNPKTYKFLHQIALRHPHQNQQRDQSPQQRLIQECKILDQVYLGNLHITVITRLKHHVLHRSQENDHTRRVLAQIRGQQRLPDQMDGMVRPHLLHVLMK
jgi:hypothetical protein